MLRIFRKIRGDLLLGSRGQKYALYATGELLLVVIGILIALQVNNWNEERIERRQLTRYAIGLISDLERDVDMLEPIIEQMRNRLEEVDALNAYARSKSLSQIKNLDLWLLTRPFSYRPYEWNRTAMEQLKSAGALQIINDTELVEKITAYESLSRHLDEDYSNDRSIIEAASNLRDLVVDSNYIEDDHFRSVADEVSGLPIDATLAKWREKYKGPELPLLTNDINDVKVLVNKYDKISVLRARADSEIPRLISLAEDLIQLLTDEFSIDEQDRQ